MVLLGSNGRVNIHVLLYMKKVTGIDSSHDDAGGGSSGG